MSCDELLPEAARLIDEAVKIALSIENPAIRDSALGAVATKAVAMNQFEKARELLDKMSDGELKIQTYREMAIAFAKRGYIPEALEMIEAIPYEEFRVEALRAVISRLVSRGKVSRALSIARSVKTDEFRNELLKFVVEEMVRNKQIEGMEEIVESISDPIYRASARNIYLSAIPKFGKEIDESLWSKTLLDIEQIRDTIIIGRGRGYLRDAEATYRKLIEMENLYFALREANMEKESKRIFGLINKFITEIEDDDDRIDALRMLIRNATFSQRSTTDISPIIDRLLEEIQGVENPLILAQVFKDIGAYYLSRGDREKAESYIKKALENADKIEEIFQRDAFYRELIRDLLKLGVHEFLEETIEKFSEARYKIEALCEYAMRVDDRKKAEELIAESQKHAKRIMNPVWLAYILQRILEAQITKSIGDVKKTLDVLLKITNMIDNSYSKATLLASIAEMIYRYCLK